MMPGVIVRLGIWDKREKTVRRLFPRSRYAVERIFYEKLHSDGNRKAKVVFIRTTYWGQINYHDKAISEILTDMCRF